MLSVQRSFVTQANLKIRKKAKLRSSVDHANSPILIHIPLLYSYYINTTFLCLYKKNYDNINDSCLNLREDIRKNKSNSPDSCMIYDLHIVQDILSGGK